jgi:hypothetical protein
MPGQVPPHPGGGSADDVRRFGAAGDGKTDDTAALQQAVAGGGRIRFGHGTYRITRTIVIDLDKVGFTSLIGEGTARIVMAGPGPAFKFVGTHQGTADPPTVKANVWERQRAPCLDGLEIVGAHAEACGIEATGTMQMLISRLIVRQALHGIHLTVRNRNIVISDCHLYDNRGIGIYYDDVDLHQSNITGCHISYNAQGGIVSRKGNVRNIQVSGCDLESNMSPQTAATANFLIDSAGSAYGTGEVAITGCTLQHNNSSPGSANIRIVGRSSPTAKQKLVREGNVTITGNVLSDVKINVHLKDCRGVVLTGNTFWQGYTHNLLIEDCSNIVVGPNNFDRNPRYDYGNTQEANNSLVVRNSEDCTLTGLHITSVWRDAAALMLENCRRLHISGCTILDCDNVGLAMKDVRDSKLTDCVIRDDRPGRKEAASLVVTGGSGNLIVSNWLINGADIATGSAQVVGNFTGR